MSKKIIGLNDMFGIPESSFEIVELGIDELVQRKDHKWKPMSEDKLAWFDESIRDVGVVREFDGGVDHENVLRCHCGHFPVRYTAAVMLR